MKKRKSLIMIIIGVVLRVILIILSFGLKVNNDVVLKDYTFSKNESGEMLDIGIALASSMGFVRTYSSFQTGNQLYLTFYRCFGSPNSSWGAKDSFQMMIQPEIEEIYFGEKENAVLVLQKDVNSGEWMRG